MAEEKLCEPMPKAEPQKEHEWLHRLVGEWSFVGQAPSPGGQPPQNFKGSESVRSLGGLWIVAEGHGEMPGFGESKMLMTLGFDPGKGRFVGTWVGSMMSNMFVYDGSLDASGKVLALETECPDFTEPGKTARLRDVIELVSDGHRILRSEALGPDGAWTTFMTAHYTRKS